jgi:hypothetical protein
VLRYGAVVLSGIIAGSKVVGAYEAWEQWRLWRNHDPSGAEAALTFAEVDLAIAALCVMTAGLIWWLLRTRSGRDSPHSS